jgi:DNA-binding NarL/FixJ family response regulator
MPIPNLRLLIVANDSLARAGLTALLANQANILVVGQASSDDDLMAALAIYRPDILLCDLGWKPEELLGQLDSLDLAEIPLVALLPDITYVSPAWTGGARGLLPRSAAGDKLAAALLAVAQGLVAIDPAFTGALLPHSQAAAPLPAEPLTPREQEVLQLLAEGLPNKSIARRLDISDHTVKFHVNAIMGKLNAQSRTEAVVRATQLGLILL